MPNKRTPGLKSPGVLLSVIQSTRVDANRQRFTWKVSVVVFVTPPPVAVIVIVEVPVGAVRETVKLKSVVPEPGAAMEVGLKL